MTAMGALALVGSGEYLPVMEPLEGALLNQGINRGKKNIFVQVPTAAGKEGNKSLTYWKSIGLEQTQRLNTEQRFLPVFTREDAMDLDLAAQIEDAALIYLSGGDPGHLASTLIDTPVWEAIRRNWESGSSLAGCSAGAMAMAGDVPNFLKMREEGTSGLNIVPHIRTIPHYNKFFGWVPDAAAKLLLKAPPGVKIIGIDESTGLVTGLDEGVTFESGMWEVHGFGGVHVLHGAPTHRYSEGERFNL
jgi:cyanophycinase